jgi:hypothetical protein
MLNYSEVVKQNAYSGCRMNLDDRQIVDLDPREWPTLGGGMVQTNTPVADGGTMIPHDEIPVTQTRRRTGWAKIVGGGLKGGGIIIEKALFHGKYH